MTTTNTVPVTAIVTAYKRVGQTLSTLKALKSCRPLPDEILAHVDANQIGCATAIRNAFPEIEVIMSTNSVGPGGGRNKLIDAARHEIIASFDDDSYPIDSGFFERAWVLMHEFPSAAIIAANIFNRNEKILEDVKIVEQTAGFGAGGAVIRKSAFKEAGGFVPLAIAYGMEEEDLSVRLFGLNALQLKSSWLRVYHDSDLGHHNSPEVTAAVIVNLALLGWLRYPASYWPYSVLQILNRILWCMRMGRIAGIPSGLGQIPRYMWRYRHDRCPVSAGAMKLRLAARSARRL